MSKPGIIYEMSFINFESVTVVVDISDSSVLIADDATPTVIPMVGSADCLHISNTDNDENKFTPIKSKKATIKFLNSDTVNESTFATGQDNRFLVNIKFGSTVL